MRKRLTTQRPGTTIIELLVAMTVLSLVLAAAVQFLESQDRMYDAGTERLAVVQNLRYASNLLERELRTTGSHVPPDQPFLVVADTHVVAFNTDYNSNDLADPFAVYRDDKLDPNGVGVLTKARQFQLPNTTFTYPDTTYQDGSVNSFAETIIFFFAPDQTTAVTGDFALYRQVNDLAPEIVARDLLPMPGKPFFEYFRIVVSGSGTTSTVQVPAGSLPLYHTADVHGSVADAGAAAVIDSVRAVRVNYRTTNARFARPDRVLTRDISRLIPLRNAGTQRIRTCGDEPLFGSSVTPTVQYDAATGDRWIDLSWAPATDESSGEEDVVRYVIWRNIGSATFGDPYQSISAGQASYLWADTDVQVGTTYYYAVAAQDCTPALSGRTIIGPVTP